MVAVIGHYISYTYIAVIIRDVVGVRGQIWPGCWPSTASPGCWRCRWWPGRWTIGPGPRSISCMIALYGDASWC